MTNQFLSSRSFARAAILTFVCLFSAATEAITSSVGSIPGSFSVNPGGAATYSIPLAVPPGTAGMQPSLSLNYSNQDSNGLVGMGWSLGGLSVITRCPQTQAQDGVRGSINFDGNDRFCLDGQRLMVVAGSYGADGAEYRTELESYSRIVSVGAAGTGPASFKVWTKSGQVMEYGVTSDSRIEAQGKSSVSVWALNKVQDTVGNYLAVTYAEDSANGSYYPTRIDYTGNARNGLTPYNSVEFAYGPEVRPDIVPMYHLGSLIKSMVRLVGIKSFAGGSFVREYRLGYRLNGANNTSRLSTITECAGDGTCLPATAISWNAESAGVFHTANTWWPSYGAWCDPAHLTYGDFNGDGKTDMICNGDDGRHIVAFSSGDGSFTSPGWWPPVWCDPGHLGFGDFNGDGKTDMICNNPADGRHLIAFSNGDGNFTVPSPWWPGYGAWCDPAHLKYGDFNGDGRTDMICNGDDGRHIVAFSSGDGNFTSSGWWPPVWCDPAHLDFGDFNGDGKADMICNSDVGWHSLAFSNGDGNFTAAPSAWPSTGAWCDPLHVKYGDFNGDGKTDMLCNSETGWHLVAFSNGDGTFASPSGIWPSTGAWCDPAHMRYGDFNGDGRTDMICNSDAGWHLTAFSNGDGTFFSAPSSWPSSGAWCDPGHLDFGDFDGDGRTDMICNNPADGRHLIALGDGAPNLVSSITTGLGVVTTIIYKPLTDNTVYTKENGDTYPTLDVQGPMYVVSASSTSDGIGGNYLFTYHYSGMRASQEGRGMLGFRTMDVNDLQTGMVTHNEYRQDYPFIGMPSLSTKTVNGALVNQSQNTYTPKPLGGTRYAVVPAQSVESTYELNGSLVTTATTTSQYDSYGNPTQIVVSTGDGYTKTTNNTYTNDATNWLLGRLKLATVTSATPSGSLTRTSGFDYNPANGLLTQEVIEPNNPALRLQTDYTYDGYGNKTTTTVSGSGIATRTTSTVFDTKGQFPTRTTNALGQSDNGTYDARFGKAATLTGPNGITTTWSYDGFGRKVNETRADGTQTNVAFSLCDASCPSRANYYVSLAKYYVVTSSAGSPTSYAYFDILNREMRVQVQGFDGRLITKDTFYDSLGRVDRVTKPYYDGGSPLYSRYQYDALGRIKVITAPDSSTQQMAYNGLTTTATNALGQTETKTKNSQGQLVSVRDNLGYLISYQYDPFSNLTKTTDPKGNVISLTYDLRGRKIGMVDPDMGTWTYTYNVLGELIQQKDTKLQTVNMSYDLLGRMLTRSEPDLNSTWVYDTAVKGIGKLKQVSSDNGFLRVITYDSLGRTSSETNTIDTTYTVSKTYDAYGRVDVLTYPTGVAIKNIYNATGYLSEVRNNANLALFWKANAKDADGNVLNETLGNGLTTTRIYTDTTGRVQSIATNGVAAIQNQTFNFDFMGNLKARTDSVAGVTESFVYDPLNRLTSASKGAVSTTVAYDSIGNISNKSDVGTYTYGARPHAVTQVAGALNASYAYDANGNLMSGAGRTVTYTSYNLPTQITQGTNSVSFLYDADHTRVRQTSASGTMIYLNPRIDTGMHFEKEIKNGIAEYKHYIYGAAGVVGVYSTKGTGPDTVRSTQYFHQDHLGSIAVVTNDSGTVVARNAFDPWGKRITLAGDPLATHHGFTGHEHLDDVGLIHMNGRVYDPILARFMSADPYIQAADNLQSYNRYSYVWNNPLSATDPSGYWSFRKWVDSVTRAIFKPTPKNSLEAIRNQPGQQYVDQYIMTHQWAYTVGQVAASVYGGAYGAAAWSTYYGYVATGSVNAGVKAGAISYATSAAFIAVGTYYPGPYENVIAHAVVGCASSAASGGSCQSGAISGALGSLADGIHIGGGGDIVVHMVAGGIGAELGGGKFANGAMMAAYGYLFNYCAHNGCFNRDFTLTDAKANWQSGNGAPITDVGANEINLTGAGYIATNTPNVFQVNLNPATDSFYIYGTVTGVIDSNGNMSFRQDTYNFDYKNVALGRSAGESGRLVLRNAGTFAGRVYNGSGTPYQINFSGSQVLPPDTVKRLRNCAPGGAC